MAAVIPKDAGTGVTVPTVDVPVVTLARICLVKKYGDGRFVRREVDALVWDPIVARALLDERIYRNPTVALIRPERRGEEGWRCQIGPGRLTARSS